VGVGECEGSRPGVFADYRVCKGEVAGSLVTSLLKASSSGGGGFEKDDIMFRVLGDACFDLRELSSRFEMWKGYSFCAGDR